MQKHTSNNIKDLKHWTGKTCTNETNYLIEQAVRDKNIITVNDTTSLESDKEVLLALEAATHLYGRY